jgi:hypothetical protein
MWQIILKYAVKVAMYAAGHPDQVKAVVDALAAARNKK